ncbi:transmembrane protein 54a [Mastacembelus armatus]|uniref:Transmembrane protein 54a n=1 Tax=Mastacembelus armatus TaxID=205130 RepID=A0A7N8YJ54_9TELE|nr:keratinocyte-associated protein 3-like [Mastacembelus armatus]
MIHIGVCCANLKDNKALMKMGLGLVLVGHVNFLLGALVHGAVLRHISEYPRPETQMYAISDIIAIVAGLLGIIVGIMAIVLSKNKKSRILQWFLLVIGFLAGLLSVAAALGLSLSIVQAILKKGQGLLTHCKYSDDDVGSSSVTYECPFDPTRVYATTVILWVLLILMSFVEMVFSFRCFAVCTSFLYLCPCRKRPNTAKRVRIQRSVETQKPVQHLETDAEAEPAEQDELLDCNTVEEQSHWL